MFSYLITPKIVIRFILVTLLALSLARLGFVIYFFERISNLQDVLYILFQGVRVDAILAGYFFLIPLLISIWLGKGKLSAYINKLVGAWILVSFVLILFMEVATPEFIHEYDVRPNRIFLDYLIYPKEVFGMLWEGYKPALAIGVVAIMLSIFVALRMLKQGRFLFNVELGLAKKSGITLMVVLLGFLVIRSSLQHRPFNPSMVYFSNDNLVNSLILNSGYSALFAMYNAGSEQSAFELYGKMDEQEIIEGVRNAAILIDVNELGSTYKDPKTPTLRFHKASYQGKPKNIVILLQESLGARHVGALGGRKLTPNLDQLIKSSWSFSQAYATGTRSVRGIEAVFTGFSPGPSQSVVKLSRSQSNFFSIASLLKQQGYQTQFIYGGESHFDNMKSFFLGNGVDDIHDLPTFKQPKFIGSWGASDEDLYNEAHHEFERMQASGKPFFSLVFTSSNHTPYEFPDGCLDTIQGERQTVENAVRYTDCALGKFLEMAKASNYWKNTLFLVIADHDSRTIGADLVPMEHFRIPAVLFGEGIEPKEDTRLVSQIDFPPTLLSLAGVSAYHPMIGFDLTQAIPESKQFAMLQYNDNFAWLTRDEITVLQPNMPAKVFAHDGYKITASLSPEKFSEQINIAKANSLWSSLAYMKGLYQSNFTIN